MARGQKAGIVRKPAAVTAWARDFPYCMACGIPAYRAEFERWPGLSTHHLVGGAARSDEDCNFLRLCQRCHDLTHGACVRVDGVRLPKLTRGHLLWCKMHCDPVGFNLQRIAALLMRDEVSTEPIPDMIEQEWTRWRPHHVRTQ